MLWCLTGAATAQDSETPASKKLTIVATIGMIGEPLSVIAGEHADVKTLLGEGVDPHLYRPTATDIRKLRRADIIISNGLTLEAQLEQPIEQLSRRAATLAIGEALADDLLLPYDNGPGDPHIWMDPKLWRQALSAAVELIAGRDPAHADQYRRNAAAYFGRLDALEAYADQAMASIPEDARRLVTAHDAFSYFGERFGIEVHGIQGISTESEAGLLAIEGLVDLLVDKQVPAVFVETSVSDRHVRALIEGAAARGAEVRIGGSLFSDAMGAPGTYEGTYIGMIDHNVTTIARALGGVAPEPGLNGRLGGHGDP